MNFRHFVSKNRCQSRVKQYTKLFQTTTEKKANRTSSSATLRVYGTFNDNDDKDDDEVDDYDDADADRDDDADDNHGDDDDVTITLNCC